MEVHSKDLIQRTLIVDGIWEPKNTEIFQKIINPGWTIYDVGANVGYFTLLFAKCAGPRGRIIAFEPAKNNFEALTRNIELNPSLSDTIKTEPIALSNKTGRVLLVLDDKGNVGSTRCLERRPETSDESDGHWAQSLPADEYRRDIRGGRIDLIKIDVEGHELKVLEGMLGTLGSAFPPILAIEVRKDTLAGAGVSPEGLYNFTSSTGYTPVTWNRQKGRFTYESSFVEAELVFFLNNRNPAHRNLLA